MFGLLLLLLMLVFPNTLQLPKAVLLFFVLFGIVIKNSPTIKMIRSHWYWLFLFVGSNTFFILYGFLHHNPAPFSYFLVYCVWPIVFIFIAQHIDELLYQKINRLFVYTLLCINILGFIAFVLFNLNIYPEIVAPIFTPLIKPGFPFLAISGPVVTSFIFLYFYNFVLTIVCEEKNGLYLVNTILGLLFILLTARRIIYIDIPISICILYLLSHHFNLKTKYFKRLLNHCVLVGLLLFSILLVTSSKADYSVSDFCDLLYNAFGNGDENDPRVAQSSALISGWLERPFLGNGTGVDASMSRSETPGTYELSYHAMLFERGIIGFLIFCVLYIRHNWICIKNVSNCRIDAKYIIAYMVALSIFMISNATNPYLYAFDYLWILFFGFVFTNRFNFVR